MKSNQLLEPIKLNEALQLEGIQHNQQASNCIPRILQRVTIISDRLGSKIVHELIIDCSNINTHTNFHEKITTLLPHQNSPYEVHVHRFCH